MPKIEGFSVKNYRVLKDVTLGKLWNTPKASPLTPLTTVIGKNGVGKSSLFDAFGFLADCLKLGVEEACDVRGRGGFERIRSQGADGPIEFVVYYRQAASARPITYEVAIALDRAKRPTVVRERLWQRRSGQRHGRPFSFLMLEDGKGTSWGGNLQGYELDEEEKLGDLIERIQREPEDAKTQLVELEDKRRLGIATLGALAGHPRIASFREFVEGWYLSYFTPEAARGLPIAGPQRRLSEHGDNLGNFVQYMERDHPERFRHVLRDIATKIPGIDRIETMKSQDGRLLLRFNDRAAAEAAALGAAPPLAETEDAGHLRLQLAEGFIKIRRSLVASVAPRVLVAAAGFVPRHAVLPTVDGCRALSVPLQRLHYTPCKGLPLIPA